jgi:hypothetical protein
MEKNAPHGVVIVAVLVVFATLYFLSKIVYDCILLQTNADLPPHWKRYLKNEIKSRVQASMQ